MTWGLRINIACALLTTAAWVLTGFHPEVFGWWVLVILSFVVRVVHDRSQASCEAGRGHGGVMGGHWASHAVEALQRGEEVQIRPRGNSMRPKVESGALVTLAPAGEALEEGAIVLVKVKGRVYLHLVSAVRGSEDSRQYQISNNRGHINGWVKASSIYGVATEIENG